MATKRQPPSGRPRWRDWLDWAALGISAAAFGLSVWTAFYTKGQYLVAKEQLDVAIQTFKTSQENIAITLARMDDGPLERSPTTFMMPHEGRKATLLVEHWTVVVSNTSTSAATSIVRFEISGRQPDGTLFTDPIDSLSDLDKKTPVRLPVTLAAGAAVSYDLRASIPISAAAARILERLQMPQKTRQVEDALAPIGQDLFGNQMTRSGDFLVVGGSGIPNDPTVELVAVTSRGQRFSAQGNWYLR